MEYLDFELPLKELEDQLEKCNEIRNESKVDGNDVTVIATGHLVWEALEAYNSLTKIGINAEVKT